MPTNLQTALKMLDEIPQAELRVFKAREIIREALASHEALSARVEDLELRTKALVSDDVRYRLSNQLEQVDEEMGKDRDFAKLFIVKDEMLRTEVAALSAEVADMRARKDVAYDERNRMVAVLTKLFPASLERHPEEDLEWEDDWRWVVYIDSPAGQLSWHIHDRQVPMFEHLPRFQGRKWDGHTTEDKYKRLSEMPVQAAEVAEVAGLRTAAKDLLTHTILYRQTHRVCEMPDHEDCSDKSNLERSINALRAAIDAARQEKKDA